MKRILIALLLLFISFSLLVSCDKKASDDTRDTTTAYPKTETESVAESEEAGEIYGTYFRKNSNRIHGTFTVTLNSDGSYSYYETMISSHLGFGKYTVDGNVITLIDDNIPTLNGSATYIFKFEYRNGKLIYLAEESDKFMYINLPDGAEFSRVPAEK